MRPGPLAEFTVRFRMDFRIIPRAGHPLRGAARQPRAGHEKRYAKRPHPRNVLGGHSAGNVATGATAHNPSTTPEKVQISRSCVKATR